jgi:hypothetical protein
MKHVNRLLLFLFLLPLVSAAQSNYRPGYIVTLKGDTVRGFINYQAWDANPTAISFKSTISDRDKKTYTLNDIGLFSVTGLATYKKYTCNISTDITNTSHLVGGRDTSFRIETIFLQILQKGKNLALYAYTDDQKTRFYIGDAPDYTPVELSFRIYNDVSAEGAGKTVTENTYQKQLFSLANKYNALDDKTTGEIENSNYSEDNLLAIVSRINNISKSEYDKKYTAKTKFGFYVSGALNISTTTSPSGLPFVAGGASSSYSSYLPAAAIGLNINPNPVSGKVEFRVDLSVAPGQFNESYQLKVSPYTGAKASFDQLNISISPQIIFNFYNSTHLKIFVGAGGVITRFNFTNPYFGNQNSAAPAANFPDEPYYFLKNGTSFLLKTGFRIHKNWEVFFNYIIPTSITPSPYFGFNNSVTQIGASYFFGK